MLPSFILASFIMEDSAKNYPPYIKDLPLIPLKRHFYLMSLHF